MSSFSVIDAADGVTKVPISVTSDANNLFASLHLSGFLVAGVVIPVSATNPLPVTGTLKFDPTASVIVSSVPFEPPFSGAVNMVVGTAQAAQRAVLIVCTVAGNVQLSFVDNSTITFPVAVGPTCFPGEFTTVVGAGTTATATFTNLK